KPIIFGGGQQKDMRSGTENVPGIAGLALASKMIYQDLELKTEHMRELKTHFIDCISQIGNVKVHGLTDEG
ncbi:cysteine desulfurase NifS, partial [Agathobaculum butyriciproducens]|nr:cysteine desulfurase NifS [Agathobaculum butyriciproducens]